MTIGLPGWLTWLGDKMGEEFPDGDEDALRRLAQQFREVADGLESESLSSTRTAISTALDNIEGSTRDALETEYASLTSGEASIQALVSQVRSLADGLESMGTEVEFTKEMYIANLVVLAATIVMLLATAWFNWSAPAEVTVAIAATRAAITRLVVETVGRIVSEQVARVIADMAFNMVLGAAMNTAISVGMDLGVQGIQNLEGTRHGVDWGRVGADAESAAITGVLAGGVAGGLGRVAPGVDNVARNYVQGVAANTVGMVGAQEITTGHVDVGSAVGAGLVFGGVDALGRSLHGNESGASGEPAASDVPAVADAPAGSGLAEGELSPDLMAEIHRADGVGAGGVPSESATTAAGTGATAGGADGGHGLPAGGEVGGRAADSGVGGRGVEPGGAGVAATSGGAATAGEARAAAVAAPRPEPSARPTASVTSVSDGARLGGGAGIPVTRIADSAVTPVARPDGTAGGAPVPEGSRGTPVIDPGRSEPMVTHLAGDDPAPGPGPVDPRPPDTPGSDDPAGPTPTTGEIPGGSRGSGVDPVSGAPPSRPQPSDTAAQPARADGGAALARDSAAASKDDAAQQQAPNREAPSREAPNRETPEPRRAAPEPGRAGVSDAGGARSPRVAGEPVATPAGEDDGPAGGDVSGSQFGGAGVASGGHAAGGERYVPESGEETCAADVVDYLSETTGGEFVLPHEPTARGIPARDLFEAVGSEAGAESYGGIHDTLLGLGDGAQALIASRWAADGEGLGGHAYVAVNDGGVVHLVDPITGARLGWPPHWGEQNVGVVVAGYFHPDGSAVHPLVGEAGLHAAFEVGEVGAGPRSRWLDPGRGEPVGVIDRPDLGVGAEGTPVREKVFEEWTARIEPRLDPAGLGREHPDFREVARHEREVEYPVGTHPVYPEHRVFETTTGVGGNELTLITAVGENGLEVPVGGKVVIGEVFDRVDRPSAEVSAQRIAASGQGVQEVFEGDQGGHVFGFRFVLAQGLRNMFAQDGHFNMVPYRVMENEWSDFARYGARVEVEIDLEAPAVGQRPDMISIGGLAYSAKSNVLLRKVKFDKDFSNDSSQQYKRQYFKKQILALIAEAEGER
ncbi:toxin glutamine deamidase domain-containing protein [Gordonia sp. DT219]|uniref:WXG100-like domain-containing protein n=1 Tax=Gordonia sp. DT219 TaxID=3416658 RepID=UPI003CEC8F22